MVVERPRSLVLGRDGEVLKQILPFYARPPGPILDVTAGSRRMWKGLNESPIYCDIDATVHPRVRCDFSALPFPSAFASLIVFDPPHLPRAAGSPRSLAPFKKAYGLETAPRGDNVSEYFVPFLRETLRVLKQEGLIFTKLADYVHNHKYQWMLVLFVEAVQSISGLTPCDLLIKGDPAAGRLMSGRWQRAHHARRSHCWWIVVRKGKCESKA